MIHPTPLVARERRYYKNDVNNNCPATITVTKFRNFQMATPSFCHRNGSPAVRGYLAWEWRLQKVEKTNKRKRNKLVYVSQFSNCTLSPGYFAYVKWWVTLQYLPCERSTVVASSFVTAQFHHFLVLKISF